MDARLERHHAIVFVSKRYPVRPVNAQSNIRTRSSPEQSNATVTIVLRPSPLGSTPSAIPFPQSVAGRKSLGNRSSRVGPWPRWAGPRW